MVCNCPGDEARCSTCGVARRAGVYRTMRVLGEGAASRVYLAEDASGARVALKELLFAKLPDVATLTAFEREAKMLAELDHPDVPRFVDSFQEGEGPALRLYIAQQYVEGTSLLEALETARFSEESAKDVARRVLAILVHLQSLSPPVFHRDVKPQNLIRRADGSIALVDFGAARGAGETSNGTLVGTFGYMPSEQLAGIVDRSTDLHALGATLIHLLSRRAPWEVRDGSKFGSHIQVSPRFLAFVERLTAPHGRRFASADAALAALDSNAPLSAPSRAPWVATAATAACLMTGALVLFSRPRPASAVPSPSAADSSRPVPSAAAAIELERLRDDVPWLVERRRLDGIRAGGSEVTTATIVASSPREAYVYVAYDYRGEAGEEATICASLRGTGDATARQSCKPTSVRKGRGFTTVWLGFSEDLAPEAVAFQLYDRGGKVFAVDGYTFARPSGAR